MRWWRLWAAGSLVAAATVAVAPTLTAADASSRPVVRIQASNLRFCADSAAACTSGDENYRTRVVVGTKVKWIYRDAACDAIAACPGHNVKRRHHHVSPTVKADGALITSVVFNSVGKFHYWCTIHRGAGMTGTVVVRRR
jgi:plastocyanin